MENYVGKICPFCKTEIKEEDSVKVCPACNIPHHEGCWEENKGCTTFGCSEQHYEEQHTNPTDVCANCGAPLGDGQAFCPSCGTKKEAEKKNVCSKCGAELQEGQAFCPSCGQKAGLEIDAGVSSAISQFNAGVQKKNKKNALLPIIIAVVAVAIVAVIFIVKPSSFSSNGVAGTILSSVDEILLSEETIELNAGESEIVSYTIAPAKAADADVEWKSSNTSVATVSSAGKITAKGEGSCTITVTAEGKSDSLKVIVKELPDFNAIYKSLGSPYYCDVASDGSYLSMDTNWLNMDDYFDSNAYNAIEKVIDMLELPESLLAEMGETRSIDGRQSADYDVVTVSWSYHPDKGLEVMFKIK